ncbi:hypothetical protein H0H92_016138 [Tricholoma furcatifolium]|nr:hypothetical protein H0H92_016138 [Tricholoma furcatifolium]
MPLYADQEWDWLNGDYTIGGREVHLDPPPVRSFHRDREGKQIMDYILIPSRRLGKSSQPSLPVAVCHPTQVATVKKKTVKPSQALTLPPQAGPSCRCWSPLESPSEGSSLMPTPHTPCCTNSPRCAAHLAQSPPPARMVVPPSPVACPALQRSALAFFALPAYSPNMFHEELNANYPQDIEDRAMWQHYFVDRIPAHAWQKSGYTPLPAVCAAEAPLGYPSPTIVPMMALQGFAELNADKGHVAQELEVYHGFLRQPLKPMQQANYTVIAAFLEALLDDIWEAKAWLRCNNLEHLF